MALPWLNRDAVSALAGSRDSNLGDRGVRGVLGDRVAQSPAIFCSG